MASLAATALADVLPVIQDQVQARGKGQVTFGQNGIRLQIDNPHGDSGVRVTPPVGSMGWDLSGWKVLAVDVENLSSDRQARLLMQVYGDNGAGKPRDSNVGIALNPGEKRTMRLRLPHRWLYAHPDGVPGVRNIDTAIIPYIDFFMQWPFESTTPGLLDVRISNLRTEDALTPTQAKSEEQYVPFIDEYGQFIHDDWPAKIHSPEDLARHHAEELAELAKSTRPDEWNKYGGWKNGPQLEATGNFRVEKYNGKWYFVDPDGRLFISQGIDVISKYNDPLRVMPGHEDWFKFLPDRAKTYQPTEQSLQLKYGKEDYSAEYFDTVVKRLEHWGMNTIGNWSAKDLMLLGKMPYTLQLTDYDWKMPRIGGSKLKFYDVFDPVYIEKMKTLLSAQAANDPIVQKSLTDPMCIGYFIDNELNFGNRGKMILVDEIMKSPADQASKVEFVSDLKKKYGTIDKLNSAWKTKVASWDGLLKSKNVPDSSAYKEDAKVFFEKVLDQYFRLSREAVKSVAPHRLYLGCRFISTDAVRPILYEMSKKYSDVLTVNIYAHGAGCFPVEGLPDMPMLIGEFHFGLLDRGMFSASLCQTGVTQDDRALAYTRFMQGVLTHPNFVGAHWFQYRDQPLTGRGDGEAYQIGFVDVADTPYKELGQAAREVGEHMYTYRANGKLANSMTGSDTSVAKAPEPTATDAAASSEAVPSATP